MRNLKRFLAMTLTMLMVVGCFSGVLSVSAFDDVSDYQAQINLMTKLHIIEGYSEDEFGPDDDVARWQMALLIAKIMTGKVTDAYANWYSTENYTAFEDVDVDHFFGSISYAAENGIVKGTSATTFDPDTGIMIEDVFTMVVRMLGYGSVAMDNNYPWSYIDKAISLGLDKDLDESYNNEDTATRAQAAVILYNALFAAKADGTTYADANFNLTHATVVVTGTSRGNMFVNADAIGKTVASENYVAFNVIKANGMIDSAHTYYLPESYFGIGAEDDENMIIGNSYDVITADDFNTIFSCEINTVEYVDETTFDGTNDDNSKTVVIDGDKYKAVNTYSILYNGQGTKTQDDYEIVVYDAVGQNTVKGEGSYIYDANLNILDAEGNIYLYYLPTFFAGMGSIDAALGNGALYYLPYMYKLASGDYIVPTEEIWANAYRTGTTLTYGMVKITNTKTEIYQKNAYSNTVLFDDNNDEIYDRALYTYYKFAFMSYNGDGYLTFDGVKTSDAIKYADAKYIDAEGTILVAADVMAGKSTGKTTGNYVLYSYNPVLNTVTIREILTAQTGLVTSVDKLNGTITFDQMYTSMLAGNIAGNKYDLGNARLIGAKRADVAIVDGKTDGLDTIQGKNVYFVAKDGKVLEIYSALTAANYMVYYGVAGFTTTGYLNAYVYNYSDAMTVVTINSVDGKWFGASSSALIGSSSAYSYSANNWLELGDLLSATKDALGNYAVNKVAADQATSYYYNANNFYGTDKAKAAIKFENGIAYSDLDAEDGSDGWFERANGTAQPFTQFITNANTVFVCLYDNDLVITSKGIPANGATIELYADNDYANRAKVFVDAATIDGKWTAKFVYIMGGKLTGSTSSITNNDNYWNTTLNDGIIFVDTDTKASEVITNQIYTGNGITLGATRTYKYAVDFIRGGLVDVYTNTIYNFPLEAGCFYRVKDNYVVEKVNVGDESVIKVGLLTYVSEYESVVRTTAEAVYATNYKYNYVYQLSGTNIVNGDAYAPTNKRTDVGAVVNDVTKDTYVAVYYYDNNEFGAINYKTNSNVFIYSQINTAVAHTAVSGVYSSVSYAEKNSVPYIAKVTATKAAEVLYYQIDADTYNCLSRFNNIANNNTNNVFSNLGYTLVLRDKSGTIVAEFNPANVSVTTAIFQPKKDNVAYGAAQYFLVVAANTPATPEAGKTNTISVGTWGTAYTLWWTNPNTINNTCSLALGNLAVTKSVSTPAVATTYSITVNHGTVENFYIDAKTNTGKAVEANKVVYAVVAEDSTFHAGYYNAAKEFISLASEEVTGFEGINHAMYDVYKFTMPAANVIVSVVAPAEARILTITGTAKDAAIIFVDAMEYATVDVQNGANITIVPEGASVELLFDEAVMSEKTIADMLANDWVAVKNIYETYKGMSVYAYSVGEKDITVALNYKDTYTLEVRADAHVKDWSGITENVIATPDYLDLKAGTEFPLFENNETDGYRGYKIENLTADDSEYLVFTTTGQDFRGKLVINVYSDAAYTKFVKQIEVDNQKIIAGADQFAVKIDDAVNGLTMQNAYLEISIENQYNFVFGRINAAGQFVADNTINGKVAIAPIFALDTATITVADKIDTINTVILGVGVLDANDKVVELKTVETLPGKTATITAPLCSQQYDDTIYVVVKDDAADYIVPTIDLAKQYTVNGKLDLAALNADIDVTVNGVNAGDFALITDGKVITYIDDTNATVAIKIKAAPATVGVYADTKAEYDPKAAVSYVPVTGADVELQNTRKVADIALNGKFGTEFAIPDVEDAENVIRVDFLEMLETKVGFVQVVDEEYATPTNTYYNAVAVEKLNTWTPKTFASSIETPIGTLSKYAELVDTAKVIKRNGNITIDFTALIAILDADATIDTWFISSSSSYGDVVATKLIGKGTTNKTVTLAGNNYGTVVLTLNIFHKVGATYTEIQADTDATLTASAYNSLITVNDKEWIAAPVIAGKTNADIDFVTAPFLSYFAETDEVVNVNMNKAWVDACATKSTGLKDFTITVEGIKYTYDYIKTNFVNGSRYTIPVTNRVGNVDVVVSYINAKATYAEKIGGAFVTVLAERPVKFVVNSFTNWDGSNGNMTYDLDPIVATPALNANADVVINFANADYLFTTDTITVTYKNESGIETKITMKFDNSAWVIDEANTTTTNATLSSAVLTITDIGAGDIAIVVNHVAN